MESCAKTFFPFNTLSDIIHTVKPLLSGLLLSGHWVLFYDDLAEIVGSTVGVAYYSLYTYVVF